MFMCCVSIGNKKMVILRTIDFENRIYFLACLFVWLVGNLLRMTFAIYKFGIKNAKY